MINWLVYAVLGKIIIELWMKFPLERLTTIEFIRALHKCDLCSGVWIYFVLAFVFNINILEILIYRNFCIFIDMFITGIFTSFVVNIFSIGFREKYLVVNIQ